MTDPKFSGVRSGRSHLSQFRVQEYTVPVRRSTSPKKKESASLLPVANRENHRRWGFGSYPDPGPLLTPVPVAALAPDSCSAPFLPSSSALPLPLPLPPKHEDSPQKMHLQAMKFDRFGQEARDRELCKAELRHLSFVPQPPGHDAALARDSYCMPEDDCEKSGDLFERPIDVYTGSSSLSAPRVVVEEPFRLYFKGMVFAEESLAAVGVAVCDHNGKPLLEIGKPLASVGAKGGVGLCRGAVEAKALIEGLHAVLSLDIKRVNIFFDYKPLYYHVTGRWNPRQRKIADLISQVYPLQRKLEASRMFLKPRCQVHFVYKLARDAIDTQLSKSVDCNDGKISSVTCSICLEDTELSQMFVVDGCSHCYCFPCMKQHVEVKLLHGLVPGCPHDGCIVKLNVHSSRKYLTPKLLDMLTQRMEEASVPEADRLYCPYPKCSALMSKSEMIRKHQGESSSRYHPDKICGVCKKCNGLLCLSCKERWHDCMSCSDYKKLNPYCEEAQLQNLAKQRLWRQCVKCNHMIELAEGCFHMTCRCGHEFCYTCGAEWKNKKATCSCALWEEDNILYDDSEESDGSFNDEYEEEDNDDKEFEQLVSQDELAEGGFRMSGRSEDNVLYWDNEESDGSFKDEYEDDDDDDDDEEEEEEEEEFENDTEREEELESDNEREELMETDYESEDEFESDCEREEELECDCEGEEELECDCEAEENFESDYEEDEGFESDNEYF